MLGEMLEDPEGRESGDGISRSVHGLGLLPVRTVFTPDKRRTRAEGHVVCKDGFWSGLDGCRLEGYEIHMGETELTGSTHFTAIQTLQEEKLRAEGCFCKNVCGTYVHGFFDSGEISGKVIELLMRRKGYQAEDMKMLDLTSYKEEQYKKLGKVIREHLDMDEVYRILEEGA